MTKISVDEHCAICGCLLNRSGEYATPTKQGRSHATEHHFVCRAALRALGQPQGHAK
jgi:hypothetical protein